MSGLIEEKYQKLANKVISGDTKKLRYKHQTIISSMFALWNIRNKINESPRPDEKVKGAIEVSRELSLDQQELMEKNNINFIRPDLTIPGRSLASTDIKLNLDEVLDHLSDSKWGILRAASGEFVVPDNFNLARIMPLSPKVCFFSKSDNKVLQRSEVEEINRIAMKTSKNYIFSANLNNCPGVNINRATGGI